MTVHKDGYIILNGLHNHPLANAVGQVLEHRLILYEKIGPGIHQCFWCHKDIGWGGVNGVQTDHVDEDKTNNHPDNLVQSCGPCNATRSRLKVGPVHGTTNAYWHYKCRCDECKVAMASYNKTKSRTLTDEQREKQNKQRRIKRTGIDNGPQSRELVHGTRAGYLKEKRRGLLPCNTCREANAKYSRQLKLKQPGVSPLSYTQLKE